MWRPNEYTRPNFILAAYQSSHRFSANSWYSDIYKSKYIFSLFVFDNQWFWVTFGKPDYVYKKTNYTRPMTFSGQKQFASCLSISS